MSTDIATSPEREPGDGIRALGAENLHEFLRYLIASAIALAADVASLAILTSLLRIPYLYSGAVAFIVGLAVIYLLSTRWVFATRSSYGRLTEFAIFSLVGVVGLAINEGILWILTGFFGLFYLYSKAASILFVFTWNFAARKWLLFRQHHV